MSSVVHHGDCLQGMAETPDSWADAIVTDPPYGLTFVGAAWDREVPGEPFWREALRIAKPGAHLLAFGGTRTFHRLMVAIEDAGWELRDTIMYAYGTGFPKSLDVSKAIDKAAGAVRSTTGVVRSVTGNRVAGSNALNKSGLGAVGVGAQVSYETIPVTGEAKEWDGWGTALKPAWEPIILARKPLAGTVAANVLEFGTGALNIDGCRVGDFQNKMPSGVDRWNAKLAEMGYRPGTYQMGEKAPNTPPGRFPANLIHDGSDEVVALFPRAKGSPLEWSGTGARDGISMNCAKDGSMRKPSTYSGYGDDGSAARFFYSAKASKSDRNLGLPPGEVNRHPTVKPTSLMRYLVRLVTPPRRNRG